MKFLRFIIALLSCACIPLAAHPDEVKELPGLSFCVEYRHYSGYLNATKGKFLYYWFVESQRSPSKDPVVLWLNGGPGCSSLDGFLSELGPLHVSADGKTLKNNTYSWNRIANMLFLESPAGVGFSYADNKNYSADDDSTSYDNYVALQHFFQKFPHLKKNDFYITGESYAGIYIPTLSVRILNGSAKINLKGFAIGSGLLDKTARKNSIIFFAYYHGLVGQTTWNTLSKYCCNGHATQQTCNFVKPNSKNCKKAVQQVKKVVEDSGLNVYNLYAECAHSSEKNSRYSVDRKNLMELFAKPSHRLMYKGGEAKKDDPPCTNATNLRKWLNQPSVRKALHIPAKVQKWDVCSSILEKSYKKIYHTVRPQLLQLLDSGKLRGLFFNGDADMACNFLGNEWFTYDLGFKVLKASKPWKYNKQIAGFVKSYKNFSFLTVKGSGHMVPQDKPGPAFKMFDSFLSNKPYY